MRKIQISLNIWLFSDLKVLFGLFFCFFFFFFFFFFGHTHSMWNFLDQGLNLCHSTWNTQGGGLRRAQLLALSHVNCALCRNSTASVILNVMGPLPGWLPWAKHCT